MSDRDVPSSPVKAFFLPLDSHRFAPLRGAKEEPSKHKTDVRRSGQLQALDYGAPEN